MYAGLADSGPRRSIDALAMRTTIVAVGYALITLVSAATAPAAAQRADRKAVEVIFDALPPDGRTAFVSREIAQEPGFQGRALLDDENQTALERLGFVEIVDVEEAVLCPDFPSPEGCTIRDGGIFYQLLMPEPIVEGRLAMRVVRLIDGAGTGGVIRREVWDLLMVRDPALGWRAARKRLDESGDGPW